MNDNKNTEIMKTLRQENIKDIWWTETICGNWRMIIECSKNIKSTKKNILTELKENGIEIIHCIIDDENIHITMDDKNADRVY
jgi:hypothetical protein